MAKNHWTAYWQTGALTSLPMDFKENYDGELALYWNDILSNSQTPVSILDVCTGNGAIAILLQELADELDLEVSITAVDASDIKPDVISEVFPDKEGAIKKINFVGNCLVENMSQVIDHKFDLIVSQYGIEYCDTEQAAVSVRKMLNPQGRLVFVAHAPETDIHKYMRAEEQVYQYLEEVNIMNLFLQFAQNKMSANGFKSKLSQALEQMKYKIEYRGQDLFNVWANSAMQLSQMNNAVLKTQKTKIHNFYLQYKHARDRALDMLAVSEKLSNQPDWYSAFEKQGLTLIKQGDVLYRGQHNAGHFYEFKLDT